MAGPPGAAEGYEVYGTPLYVSPEAIRRGKVDGRSDIYSLGMVCYRMMTGQRPFGGMDVATVFKQHLDCEVPDPRSIDPDLPEDLCKFLLEPPRRILRRDTRACVR